MLTTSRFEHKGQNTLKPFDPTKPVQTANGNPARIVATDLKGADGVSILALVRFKPDGPEIPMTYYADGRFYRQFTHPNDLFNVVERIKRTWFANIYRDYVTIDSTHNDAVRKANHTALAVGVEINIDVPEGYGK
jgi:hypothetical protein